MKYIDIHSHLNLEQLKVDHESVVFRMVENNVSTITIGVDYETSKEAIEIAGKYDFIWAGVGLHPTDNANEDFDIEKYEVLAQHKKVVCIGECGLDYFRVVDEATKEKQKELFKSHIEIALKVGKPLMIHARPSKGSQDAYEDALEILENYKKENNSLSGNFHFFVGDIPIATRVLAINFTMSFDGPITFTSDYDEVIRFIPIESIMSETDSPFAAPAPYRGKTCEPYMVREVVKKIAILKNLTEHEASEVIFTNAKRTFHI
ncbi:MAG: TatD family hydrolase [Candidatus Nomurabacteria bacterium]|nr:TatD family hydrolase [Candidatus Nomurabacteria bacterium]